MTGPHTKIGAKVIEKAVTEVGKQQGFTNVPQEGSPFKQMLDSMYTGSDLTHSLGITNQEIGLPSHEISSISASGIDVDMSVLGVGLDRPSGINKVVDLLSEVNKGQMKMEHTKKLFQG